MNGAYAEAKIAELEQRVESLEAMAAKTLEALTKLTDLQEQSQRRIGILVEAGDATSKIMRKWYDAGRFV